MRGAGIEIANLIVDNEMQESLPMRGAGIEIGLFLGRLEVCRSPCGERGLKYTIKTI